MYVPFLDLSKNSRVVGEAERGSERVVRLTLYLESKKNSSTTLNIKYMYIYIYI